MYGIIRTVYICSATVSVYYLDSVIRELSTVYMYFQDGVHQLKVDTEVYTEDQKKLMFSQDQRYVNMKRSSELKVIHVHVYSFL